MRAIKKGIKPLNLNSPDCKTSLKKLIINRDDIRNNRKKANGKKVKKYTAEGRFYRGQETDVNSPLYHLKKLYNNKCAFCESRRTKLDVDHFRPKDAISTTDVKNHEGYFWLSYEWTNLIYVCKECNRDYKKTRFPVSKKHFDTKKITPTYQIKKGDRYLESLNKYEFPLILNPEEQGFNPLNYIEFDNNGIPKGIEEKGKKTIEIMKLDRDDLVEERFQGLEKFISMSMLSMFNTYIQTKDKSFVKSELVRLLEHINVDENDRHTLFWKYVYLKFDKFVLDHTSLKKDGMFRQICIDAFKEKFKNEILKEKPHFL